MISEASLKALEAFCSPSAAITLARASREASAWKQNPLSKIYLQKF